MKKVYRTLHHQHREGPERLRAYLMPGLRGRHDLHLQRLSSLHHERAGVRRHGPAVDLLRAGRVDVRQGRQARGRGAQARSGQAVRRYRPRHVADAAPLARPRSRSRRGRPPPPATTTPPPISPRSMTQSSLTRFTPPPSSAPRPRSPPPWPTSTTSRSPWSCPSGRAERRPRHPGIFHRGRRGQHQNRRGRQAPRRAGPGPGRSRRASWRSVPRRQRDRRAEKTSWPSCTKPRRNSPPSRSPNPKPPPRSSRPAGPRWTA